MEKSFEETARERRAYIQQIRSSFEPNGSVSANYGPVYRTQTESVEEKNVSSTFGIRVIIAILIFAAFVYCDKENITYHNISTKEVFSQIEWNPLPLDEITAAE